MTKHMRFLSYTVDLPHVTFDNTKNLKLLYANRVLRDLVNKLSFFFLPIFLYGVGIEVELSLFKGWAEFQQGIGFIALFYIISSVSSLGTIMPVGQLTRRMGHHKMLMFSYFLRSLMFASMYIGTWNWRFILLSAVLNGVQNNFFWPGFYTQMLKDTHRKNMGKDLGVLQVMLQLVAAVSPAISGFLAVIFGMDILFLLGLFGTLAGIVLTMKLDHIKENDQVSFGEFFIWFREHRFKKLTFSIMGKQVYDMVLFLWPLYVFFILGSVDKVGYLYTLSLFLAMMLTLFIGSYLDSHKNRKPFLISGGFLTGLWIARIWVFSPWSIALADLSEKLVSNFHWLFFDRVLFTRGKGTQAYSYFVYREMMVMCAILVFWLFVIGLFYANIGWNAVFLMGSIGVLLSIMIKEKLPIHDV